MSTSPDPFEFVKSLWGQMGIPGFGAAAAPGMPAFAPEDLEKRIAELRQIRQWLEINLNMLNLQVNGLEMQLAAIKGFKSAVPGAAAAATAAPAGVGAAPGAGTAAMPPWPDPTAWMQSLQAEFVKNMQSVMPPAGASPQPAAKPSRKASAPARPRRRP